MKEIEILTIDADTDKMAAFDIRRAVFCREQGVPEDLEMDGLDGQCAHYLVRVAGVAVGTARTRRLAGGDVKIERVAVLAPYRGRGIGRALMRRVMTDIGAVPTVLNAQLRTVPFYAALGFMREGDVFDEAGIAHVRMTRRPAG